MKLQIKDSGAWRNVCSFDHVQQTEVMKAAEMLLRGMAPTRSVFRVINDEVVLSYCEAPSYIWRSV